MLTDLRLADRLLLGIVILWSVVFFCIRLLSTFIIPVPHKGSSNINVGASVVFINLVNKKELNRGMKKNQWNN